MKIAAVTKFKHGMLVQAMRKLGWTNAELARRSGLGQGEVGIFVNLRERPTANRMKMIQDAFGNAGVYFNLERAWPEEFKGLKKVIEIVQIADIEPAQLTQVESVYLTNEKKEMLDIAMSGLRDQDRKVIEGRFLAGKTLEQIGAEMKCTRERVRQIETKSLKRLRMKMAQCQAFDDVNPVVISENNRKERDRQHESALQQRFVNRLRARAVSGLQSHSVY